MSKKTFEEIIRHELDGFEYPFDPADWAKLEKDLPVNSGISGGYKHLTSKIIGGVLVIAVISISTFLLLIKPAEKTAITQSTHTEVITNEKQTQNQALQPSSHRPENNNSTSNSSFNQSSETSLTQPAVSERIESNSITKVAAIGNSGTNNTGLTNQVKVENPYNIPENLTGFTISESEGCSPLGIQFTPSHISDTISYLWKFDDGEISTLAQAYHYYRNPGNFRPSLTIKFKKSKKEFSQTLDYDLVVKANPDAGISFEASKNLYRFSPRSGNYQTCKWTIPGIEVSGNEPEVLFPHPGKYKVSLMVSGHNGCVAQTTSEMNVKVDHIYYVPTAFTPDGDGRNDEFGVFGENLSAYTFSLQVFDRNGVLVFQSTNPDQFWDGRVKSNLHPADSGVYIWKVVTRDEYGYQQERTGSVSLFRN